MIRHKIFGYDCDLPDHVKVQSVDVDYKLYSIVTQAEIIKVKACHKCKRLLVLDKFYGCKSPCKECHIFLVKQYQKRNPDKVREHKRICNKNYRYKQKLKSVGLE